MKKYPVFSKPERYLRTREPGGWRTTIKRNFEKKAIHRLLDGIDLSSGILDVPSGPGRMFWIWAGFDAPIYAIDFSEDFVGHATQMLARHRGDSWAARGDAFSVSSHAGLQAVGPPSLVASVRFIYYFKRSRRLQLLSELRQVGAPYILVQYLVKDSLQGRRARFVQWLTRTRNARRRGHHLKKKGVSSAEMFAELREAGLDPIASAPSGPLSKRVYILCRS